MTIIVVPKRKMLPLQKETTQPKPIDTGEAILPLLVGYLQNLVEDLTPQLGGNLDINGHTIPGYLANIIEDTTPQLGGDLDLDGHYITMPTGTILWITHVDAGGMIIAIESDLVTFQIPIDMNANKITELGTPVANTDAATKKYVDDANAVEWTEPARSIDTTYTNSSGYPLLVVVTINMTAGEGNVADIKMHASSDPPTTQVARIASADADSSAGILVALVPNGYKYRVNDINGIPSVGDWHEYAIGKA